MALVNELAGQQVPACYPFMEVDTERVQVPLDIRGR
jgi:hypothetical protein